MAQMITASVCIPVFWATGWIYSITVVNTVTLITVVQTAFAAWRADSPNPEDVMASGSMLVSRPPMTSEDVEGLLVELDRRAARR